MKSDKLSIFPVSGCRFTSFTALSPSRLLPLAGFPGLSRDMRPPLRTAPVERHTSREAAGRAGPDMAEGRVFIEPRGKARSGGGAAAGCATSSREGTAGRGCWGHSGSREPSSRASPGRLGPGSSAFFLRQRPSGGLRPHGTTAGCGARLGGTVPAPSAAAGIPRAAGEAP